MRTVIRILGCGSLILCAMWQAGSIRAQGVAGLSTKQIIQMSTATKMLDYGTSPFGHEPTGWSEPGFDDSTWDQPAPISSTLSSCLTQTDPRFAGLSFYWGPNEGDSYLFRQDFTLPPAKSYSGSDIATEAPTNDSGIGTGGTIFVNGVKVDELGVDNDNLLTDQIGQYLKPGANVLAIEASSVSYQDGQRGYANSCSPLNFISALDFTLTLRITDIQTSSPSSHQAVLVTTLPGQNAVLSGSNMLPFSWKRFSGASYYYLQFWLVTPASGQQVTARSVLNFAARLTGTHYALNTRSMPRGTYSWRMAAVSKNGKLLSSWTPEQRVTLE